MPKPTDKAKWAYQLTDDIGFSQKCILIHPENKSKFLTIRRSPSSTNSELWDLLGGNVLFGSVAIIIKSEFKILGFSHQLYIHLR